MFTTTLGQSLNALYAIRVSFDSKLTDLSFLHPSKTAAFINFTDFGIDISVSEKQKLKALVSIYIKFSGRCIADNCSQCENAAYANSVKFLGSTISFKLVQK